MPERAVSSVPSRWMGFTRGDRQVLHCPRGHRLRPIAQTVDAATVECLYEEAGSPRCGAILYVFRVFDGSVRSFWAAEITAKERKHLAAVKLSRPLVLEYLGATLPPIEPEPEEAVE